MSSEYLVEVEHLKQYFPIRTGFASTTPLKAVDDVSFYLNKGETLGLVGESGCGKTVTAKSILRLFGRTTGTIADGSQILFEGKDILKMDKNELSDLRGAGISMIFQDSMTSLNPTMRVGKQIAECIRLHNRVSRQEAMQRACELLRLVEIPNPEERLKNYPHQMSGGMRQRVMIAMALACNPRLIIADEPTTALDVTIQAQILDLLRDVRKKMGGSIMLITHDLGVIAEMADYVHVMYAGKVVESGTVQEIFKNPLHPYTIGLQKSKPVVGQDVDRLYSIPGQVPNPINMPDYCYFKERCDRCTAKCNGEYPGFVWVTPTHGVACYCYAEEGKKNDERNN